LWGFQDLSQPTQAPPPEEAVARIRSQALAPGNLHQDANRVWSDTLVTLDIGSIGKGSALSGAAALLRANGLQNFLVNAGGDIYASGSHGERPWRVGVRDPRSAGILGVLTLGAGETVSSSGDYERFFVSGTRRYHHIIDPRTGYPSNGTAGTTVLCRDAELAHVASTGLMVAGREGFDALVQQLGIEFALLVADDGTMIMTPGMRARFAPEPGKM
jgi:FAD:protein FMN transferase